MTGAGSPVASRRSFKHSAREPRMELSVVIVNWNTKNLLLDCLRTVAANRAAIAGGTEVFVVDNGSSDGSVVAVREQFPEVRIIETGANVGFATGNNTALRMASGRYCLLLNPDTQVSTGTFAALIAHMDVAPHVAVGSPLLLNGDGSAQLCWARFPDAGSELTGQLDRSQSPYPVTDFGDAEKRQIMRPFAADWVGGACFLVRADALREVGLLDEGFFLYSEETEWCHRFARAGWKTYLFPALVVTHLGGRSAQSVPLASRRHLFRSRLRLYRVLYGPLRALLPSAIAALRFALFRVRHAVTGAGRHAAAARAR